MRREIAMALAGAGIWGAASLGGCSSASLTDYFKSAPPTIQVQLESQPSGADAKTSVGPGCKTPCSVAVTTADETFTVSYALAKYQPATVNVTVVKSSGDPITDPNPVFAELQPAGPPPKAQKMHPKRKPKPATAAPANPVPDPNAPPPPAAGR